MTPVSWAAHQGISRQAAARLIKENGGYSESTCRANLAFLDQPPHRAPRVFDGCPVSSGQWN
jgi:hypothetical protein